MICGRCGENYTGIMTSSNLCPKCRFGETPVEEETKEILIPKGSKKKRKRVLA